MKTGVAGAAVEFVVFDLDGTLVDSRRDLAESANAMLEACGSISLAEERIGRMVGDGAATLVSRVFAAAGSPAPPDALDRFLAVYNARLLRFTRPYPGVVDTLAGLQSRVPLAVLTNKPLAATLAILDGLNLARFFRGRVVGGDGPFPRKPNPAGLMSLVEAVGVAARFALLVGDSAVDWRTAQAAGAQCAVARYGFGFMEFPIDQLTETDRIIDRTDELLAFL